jgi:hypothetical protein
MGQAAQATAMVKALSWMTGMATNPVFQQLIQAREWLKTTC